MDPQSLTRLFATTYDSNPNTRKTGELAVRKVRVLRATGVRQDVHLSSGLGLVFCVVTTHSSFYLITACRPRRRAPCPPAGNCVG